MAAINLVSPPLTMSDTSEHVVLADTDLMLDPKQPNVSVGLQLYTLSGSTLAGTWKVYVSCNSHSVPAADAQWSDVSSAFSPSIAAQTTGASTQFVQLAPVYARSLHVTFTPTSGSGSAAVAMFAVPSLGPTVVALG